MILIYYENYISSWTLLGHFYLSSILCFSKHKEINYIGTRYYWDTSVIKINQKSLNHISQNLIEPNIIYDDLKKIPQLLRCFDEKN